MADNEFGYTIWGMDWVRLAEPISLTKPEPLLPRARSIARNGGVETEIENTMVRATIHRGSEASVTYLEFAPLPSADIRTIAGLVPAGALSLADELHGAILGAGVTLAPTLASVDCSCRARTERCVHMLATCYTLARQVDENPWLALDLRGYRTGGSAEDPVEVPVSRWTPLDTLDPAAYFDLPAN
ncbi:hypothetical protein HLB23_14885 [Nocardia uniformis]|uniref:SWIM-type domain-containing protein n=1 Tax=Nocardia uniformis TaxID=53432 RepID=A0A849C0Z3_9NOCA|nr:hypothetical protein [Nocardia uniformis]NNH71136.1 hypothetical protein [Nocardia uniformis]